MSDRTLRTEMLIGEENAEKLRNSHAAVFGLGGVGSWCAEALCRAGIGTLTLVDQDTVSVSNINRQLCALDATVGLPKAEVMAERLLGINPDIHVIPIVQQYNSETRDYFFSGSFDFVADAIDLVSCKLDLICTCMDRGIPIISALGTGNKADASRLRITDISKTSGCPLARVVRKELRERGIEHLDVVFSDEIAIRPSDCEAPPPGRRSVPGSLVWVPASAGMLMAQHIVLTITGFKNPGK